MNSVAQCRPPVYQIFQQFLRMWNLIHLIPGATKHGTKILNALDQDDENKIHDLLKKYGREAATTILRYTLNSCLA